MAVCVTNKSLQQENRHRARQRRGARLGAYRCAACPGAGGHKADIVSGTSIGALIGGVYLAHRLDAWETWARALNKLKLTRLFDFQLGRGGLIAGRRIMQIFRRGLA